MVAIPLFVILMVAIPLFCHPDGREATGGPALLLFRLNPTRTLTATFIALTACNRGPTGPSFTLTAVGAVPATIVSASVGDSIRLRVANGDGNPAAGVSVSFAVTAGGGRVSPTTAVTDAQGRAAAKFTAGPLVGVNTVTATVAGAAPISFSVTTTPGPAATIAFGPRISFVDINQRTTTTLTAADANGNPVTAAGLSIAARTPAIVSIGSDGSITGIGVGSTVVVASSSAFADSVLVVVTSPGGPVLQSNFTSFDVTHDATITVPVVLDMRTPTERLGATTISARWDPAQLTFVSQADGSGTSGAVVVTNDTQVSQGILTLAVVATTGLPGRIELRRITFRVASNVGRTGTLRLAASEVSAAGSFADLLPKTNQVTYPLIVR